MYVDNLLSDQRLDRYQSNAILVFSDDLIGSHRFMIAKTGVAKSPGVSQFELSKQAQQFLILLLVLRRSNVASSSDVDGRFACVRPPSTD